MSGRYIAFLTSFSKSKTSSDICRRSGNGKSCAKLSHHRLTPRSIDSKKIIKQSKNVSIRQSIDLRIHSGDTRVKVAVFR